MKKPIYIASIFHMNTMNSKVIVSKLSMWDLLYKVSFYLGSPHLSNLQDLYDFVQDRNESHDFVDQIFVTTEEVSLWNQPKKWRFGDGIKPIRIMDVTGRSNVYDADMWDQDVVFLTTEGGVYVIKNRYGARGNMSLEAFLNSIPKEARGVLYADIVLQGADTEVADTFKDVLEGL